MAQMLLLMPLANAVASSDKEARFSFHWIWLHMIKLFRTPSHFSNKLSEIYLWYHSHIISFHLKWETHCNHIKCWATMFLKMMWSTLIWSANSVNSKWTFQPKDSMVTYPINFEPMHQRLLSFLKKSKSNGVRAVFFSTNFGCRGISIDHNLL